MPRTVRIDVFSDVVCPWCLIGYHRLMKAAAMLEGEIEIDLHWLPFELNPDMPAGGMDRKAYLKGKFGRRADEVYGRIARTLEEEGLDVDVNAIKRTPSTFRAHRLLMLAEREGRGTELKTRLLDAYFRGGRDVGEESVLLDLAEEAGLERKAARSWLAENRGSDEVRALEQEARRIGVQGVPFFILDHKLALSGAQEPETMCQAIREAARETADAPAAP